MTATIAQALLAAITILVTILGLMISNAPQLLTERKTGFTMLFAAVSVALAALRFAYILGVNSRGPDVSVDFSDLPSLIWIFATPVVFLFVMLAIAIASAKVEKERRVAKETFDREERLRKGM